MGAEGGAFNLPTSGTKSFVGINTAVKKRVLIVYYVHDSYTVRAVLMQSHLEVRGVCVCMYVWGVLFNRKIIMLHHSSSKTHHHSKVCIELSINRRNVIVQQYLGIQQGFSPGHLHLLAFLQSKQKNKQGC
ncbi:nebulette-like protein [Platysternon megacephalum]|uniref:Nebulette-like protein n=1 Tax=Platysternon megacephalum TaxID=55544 RepID=A0A4D9EYW3_9SAUR|nr:nebulette-like protein [Platysternon megacephalum]